MTDDERLALAERAWMENRHDERAYLLAFARALESRVLATHLATEQKAALDLAVLNIKTHGDDQLLSAVQPLIEFYESRVLAERKMHSAKESGND